MFIPLQGNIWQQVLSFHFILEMVNTIPFALTVSTHLIFSHSLRSASVTWLQSKRDMFMT